MRDFPAQPVNVERYLAKRLEIRKQHTGLSMIDVNRFIGSIPHGEFILSSVNRNVAFLNVVRSLYVNNV